MKCEMCDATIADNRWARIKAQGWFFPRKGGAYCPKHVPEWVENWRKSKKT